MKEFNGEVGHGGFVVTHVEHAGGREGRHRCRLDFVQGSHGFEGCLVLGSNGDGHALLALGHENLPR